MRQLVGGDASLETSWREFDDLESSFCIGLRIEVVDGEKGWDWDYAVGRWGRLPGYAFGTGLRSVRRTDLPMPPTWISGGAAR